MVGISDSHPIVIVVIVVIVVITVIVVIVVIVVWNQKWLTDGQSHKVELFHFIDENCLLNLFWYLFHN